MVSYDSDVGTQDNWQFQNPVFLAWRFEQEFTTPFYQFISSNSDAFMVLPGGANGTVPTAAGFTNQGIVGYAYTTPVCGSVPLLLAVNTGATDSWWTTSQADHDLLLEINTGWSDAGIAFYVLPLGAST